MRSLIAALALGCLSIPALSHEIYNQFYSSGEPGVGRWCCSGNEEGTAGDCSPATYTMLKNGDAIFTSRRYPDAKILVPAHRILWIVLPGGEKWEAHYCGIPRSASAGPPDTDNPDPNYITFCAAIAPGGV